MVAAMGCPNSTPDLEELLNVIKALEDADYWGHSPRPSYRKRSKGDPVFDTLPGEFGGFKQTYGRPPPLSAKSKANLKSKSGSTSKSASKSMPKSKPKFKDKDKDNRLMCEF